MVEILRNTIVWSFYGLIALGGYVGTLLLCMWWFTEPWPIGGFVLIGMWIVWTAFLIACMAYRADRIMK